MIRSLVGQAHVVDVAAVEVGELADARAGAQQQLHDRPVAARARRSVSRCTARSCCADRARGAGGSSSTRGTRGAMSARESSTATGVYEAVVTTLAGG
jgi:hypothetical protein